MKRALPLVVAVAAYFVAVLLWVGGDKSVARHAFDDFSVDNNGPRGASLASKVLARSGRRVEALTLALNERNAAAGAVVFRLGASPAILRREELEEQAEEERRKTKKEKPKPRTHYVTPLITDEEEAWVRRGGRLVVATDEAFGSLSLGPAPEKLARKVFPLWPGLDALDLPASRAVGGEALRNAHALYVAGEQTVMARIAVGAGEVVVFGAPEALANEHLAKNLALLAALAGGARRVYFDETIHGMSTGEGTLALLKEWGLGPMLLLLLLVAAAVFWRGGTHIGAPDDDFRDTRSEAIDLVASLGALYARSMTRGEALAAYRHELTRAVAASSGLRGDALHKRVGELTGEMAPPWKHQRISDEEFQTMLATLNAAFAKRL